MKTLFKELRSSKNLFAAWRHVKKSAQNSKNSKIRGKASEFEHQHQRHIKRIQTELRSKNFVFDKVEGVLKDKKKRKSKGKDPRPIAIGSIRNRVVQRAILQILQPRKTKNTHDFNSKFTPINDPRLRKLNDVNSSKFGVGGLMAPYGGVTPAIKFVLMAMEQGASYFYQSDIKAFFTKIPTKNVVDIVRSETGDDELTDLFASGLEVNLANEEELLSYARIFPSKGIGVAQGSSLSAFAGNVLLYDFDHDLNSTSVSAVRYIDDLFLLSSSEKALKEAVSYANQKMSDFGFSLYPPVAGSEKAAQGKCRNGFDFLGCTIQPNRCVPSKLSIDKISTEISDMLSTSKNGIKAFLTDGRALDPRLARSSTIDKIGRKLFGWEKSFSFCTDARAFRHLDTAVISKILDYENWVSRKILGKTPDLATRVLGIPSTAELFKSDKEKQTKRESPN